MPIANGLPPFSRRSFLQASSAAVAFHMMSEPLLAQIARGQVDFPTGSVRINANENPLGPCAAAREAVDQRMGILARDGGLLRVEGLIALRLGQPILRQRERVERGLDLALVREDVLGEAPRVLALHLRDLRLEFAQPPGQALQLALDEVGGVA